jgi:hypothetical protein
MNRNSFQALPCRYPFYICSERSLDEEYVISNANGYYLCLWLAGTGASSLSQEQVPASSSLNETHEVWID